MTTITDLSLENCGLTTVPASLDGLINLTSLNLWGNPDLNGKLPENYWKIQQQQFTGRYRIRFRFCSGRYPS